MEKIVLEFLKQNQPHFCAISTVTKAGQPQCAVMSYVVHDDLSIVICTLSGSRKWKNVETNPHVALVFGWEKKLNVQYEGLATLVAMGEDHLFHEEAYFKQHPELSHFRSAPTTRFIKIVPTWIRLSDYRNGPPVVNELPFSHS